MMRKTGKGDGSVLGPVRDLNEELKEVEKKDEKKPKDPESK